MDNLNLKLNQIASWIGINPFETDLVISAVSTDTRTVVQGALFVALKGENFDGHDFVKQAQQNGAVAALVERRLPLSIPQLVVADCRMVYGQIASRWHKLCNVITAVITGSNGKTTVKEMLASILSLNGKTTATKGNYNNDIGVPKTLLSITPEDSYAVIEMGANHPGEIGYLTRLIESDVALVNNAMAAHIQGFVNIEGVARAKGEIYQGLKKDGVAIINADDEFASYWKDIAQHHRQLTFGFNKEADVTATYQSDNLSTKMNVSLNDVTVAIDLNVPGKHNIANALAAIAVAHSLNIKHELIKQGIEQFTPAKGRLNIHNGIADSCIIDDSYNANPDSVMAAIDVLAASAGQTILVLGEMAELGENSQLLHDNVAGYAKSSGIDYLFALGKFAHSMSTEFGEHGSAYTDHQSLIDSLILIMTNSTTILVKGSRSSRMEIVVNALVCEENK